MSGDLPKLPEVPDGFLLAFEHSWGRAWDPPASWTQRLLMENARLQARYQALIDEAVKDSSRSFPPILILADGRQFVPIERFCEVERRASIMRGAYVAALEYLRAIINRRMRDE